MMGRLDTSWAGAPEPSSLSILSTAPTGSPQHVQDRQPYSGMEAHPSPGFFCPAVQPMSGQKPSRDGGRHSKQHSGQGRAPARQTPQAPRNHMKNNEITHQPPPWTDVTTVMMRNLPNKYTQHMLLNELQQNKFRLEHEFDFFYLPMDHYSAVNLGYCFINFVDTDAANAFAATFQGRRMRLFNSQKTILVMPASMQGFDKNYAYYSSTRVAQADESQYRPIFTRQPLCQEVAAYQPVPTVMWPQQPSAPYKSEWNMQWPQQPYISASPSQQFCSDDEQECLRALDNCRRNGHLENPPTFASNQGDHGEMKQVASDSEELHEVLSPGHSQRLLIRNTFLAVPERSPSVERCLERHCKSAPVSVPQSAVGSARIELDAKRPSGLDYAVVAAASCLAMDLGCIAVQQSAGTNSGSASTKADSERDVGIAPRQPSGSSCGSADLPSDVSPSDPGNMPILGTPQFPSKGSALHKIGSCKPCAFYCQGGPAACKNGTDCSFCHLCESGEKKRRKKDKLVMRRDVRDKIRQNQLVREYF